MGLKKKHNFLTAFLFQERRLFFFLKIIFVSPKQSGVEYLYPTTKDSFFELPFVKKNNDIKNQE